MRNRELVKLRGMLGKLTRSQRKSLTTELAALESRAASVDIVESQTPVRPACPHCASCQIVKNGSADGLQRFKCRSCAKTFNALTGTPLARLHLSATGI